MTTGAFSKIAADWFATARHPRFNRPYTELAYQPMLLRGNGFRTFIVSGGGVEFMRVIADRVYGIPPEQVFGSSGVTKFEMEPDSTPVLMKKPKIQFVDDGPGKPEGIERFIGRRPIFAFGNSDGDWQMLQWTAAGAGARFKIGRVMRFIQDVAAWVEKARVDMLARTGEDIVVGLQLQTMPLRNSK